MIFATPTDAQCLEFTNVIRGRFHARNTPETIATISEQVAQELKAGPDVNSSVRLVAIVERLTVLQIHDLKRSYGLRASGRTKAELVTKVACRLDRGRRADRSVEPVSVDPVRQMTLDLIAGKPGAFDVVYEHYSVQLKRALKQQGMKAQDAEDVVQETFLRLSQMTGSIDPDRSLAGFLNVTAKRIGIDMFRKQSRRDKRVTVQSGYEDLIADYRDSFEQECEDREEYAIVMTVLDEQPERTKRVIRMRFFEKMTFPQIASELGIGVTTVKDIVSRAVGSVQKAGVVEFA